MRTSTIIICILSLIAFNLKAQVSQIKVGKNGITFQDGEVLGTSTEPSSLIPGGGTVSAIYAEFSNNIIGDVTRVGYEDDVELLSIDSYMFREIDDRGTASN